LIAGTGDLTYINSLKELVFNGRYSKRVIFLGHMQGIEKAEVYKRSKVFVLPSYSENFGNVVLEALSFSTPVITSKYTPWKELELNKCGFWVENSPNEIKIYLEKILLMDKLEYLRYSKSAYNFVNSKYNIVQNVSKIQSTYNKYTQ
jgi:glycosyltransferase involved in cell wall biosynthesis